MDKDTINRTLSNAKVQTPTKTKGTFVGEGQAGNRTV